MMRRVLAMFLIGMGAILSFRLPADAQPSTAPSSSLPTTPLIPNMNTQNGIVGCELCRNLEGQPGSDLKLHRRHKDKDLHPHKKAKGITKSLKRSLRSQLPHRKLDDRDNQREEKEEK